MIAPDGLQTRVLPAAQYRPLTQGPRSMVAYGNQAIFSRMESVAFSDWMSAVRVSVNVTDKSLLQILGQVRK